MPYIDRFSKNDADRQIEFESTFTIISLPSSNFSMLITYLSRMRAPLGVPVVHVVTCQTKDLIRAEVALDHGRGGPAQVARCSARGAIVAVCVVVCVSVCVKAVVVVVVDAAVVIFLRWGSNLFIFGLVNVSASDELMVMMVLILKFWIFEEKN